MKTGLLILFAIGLIGFSGTVHADSVSDDEFQNAMKRCIDKSKVFAYGTVIQNSTHYFDDTIDCFIFDNRMIKGSDDVDAEKRVYENFPYFLKAPLKQIKSGIALTDVKCNEGKYPAYKYDRMRIACVSEETQNELWSRGWAKHNNIQIRNPVSTLSPPDPMSIMMNGKNMPLTILIKAGETKEIDILLGPKIPIISSTVNVESYFGSAGECSNIDADSYCPGRGIEMHLSDTLVKSQKELTLTIIIPSNMTGGTYAYLVNTDTLFESPESDELRTVGKHLRFDLKVENEN